MADTASYKKFFTGVSAAAATATVAGVIASLAALFSAGKDAVLDLTASEIDKRIETIISKEMMDLRSEIDTSIKNVLSSSKISEGTETSIRIQHLNQRLDEISKQLGVIKTIEKSVTDNPERAMSIPILRKDVDLLRADAVEDLSALEPDSKVHER